MIMWLNNNAINGVAMNYMEQQYVNLSLLTVTGRLSAIPEHSASKAPRWARAMKPAKQATVQRLKKSFP